MNKNIDIAVTYHKDSLLFQSDYIRPIHAGKKLATCDLGIRGDNSGDNISEKNCHYAELTVLYWLWKNSNADIKGLFHYRRLFDLSFNYDNPDHIFVYDKENSPQNILEDLGLTNKRIEELTEKYDMLIPFVEDFSYETDLSVSSHYAKDHDKKHLQFALDAIEKLYPKYLETAISTLSSTTNFFTNMFIMKKELFDECCKWLFDIMFEIEKQINPYSKKLSPYDYQMRWAGFLGERLVGVFLHQKIKEGVSYLNCPKAFIDSPYQEKNNSNNNERYNLSVIYRPSKIDNITKTFIFDITNQLNCNCELNIITDKLDKSTRNILKKSCPKFNYFDERDYKKILEKTKGKYIYFANENTVFDNNHFAKMLKSAKNTKSQMVISTYNTCCENNINNIEKSIFPYTLLEKNFNVNSNIDVLLLNPNLYNVVFEKEFLMNFEIKNDMTEIELWWQAVLNAEKIEFLKSYSLKTVKLNNFKFENDDLEQLKKAIENISSNIENEDVKYMFDNFKKVLLYQIVCSNNKDIVVKNDLGKNIVEFVKNILSDKNLNFRNKFENKLEFYQYDSELMQKLYENCENSDKIFNIISEYKTDLTIDYIKNYWRLHNNMHTL